MLKNTERVKEIEKKLELGRIGRRISFACCGASIANIFAKSDLLQDIVWCVLGVALLCIILEDSKIMTKIYGHFNDMMLANMYLHTLPDEIIEELEECEAFSEEQIEQIKAIVWESYFQVEKKINES